MTGKKEPNIRENFHACHRHTHAPHFDTCRGGYSNAPEDGDVGRDDDLARVGDHERAAVVLQADLVAREVARPVRGREDLLGPVVVDGGHQLFEAAPVVAHVGDAHEVLTDDLGKKVKRLPCFHNVEIQSFNGNIDVGILAC